MSRFTRHERKTTARTASHPYELRIIEDDRLKTLPIDDLDSLKQKYTLEFLRRADVAVVDMFTRKPVLF